MTLTRSRTLAAQTHGRYLVVPADPGAGLLVGFHGYAENAEMHLEDLQRIGVATHWTLVSIQGLHAFYNRANDVVASWMTRQNRTLAIEDNIAYVGAVIDEVSRELGAPRRLVVAGFSQGVAMAYRAAALGNHACHGVIALAGDLPPELQTPALKLPPVLIGRGTDDAWYTDAKMSADLQALARAGVPVESFVFEGGHQWTPVFCEAAARFLTRLEQG
jgi:predicted esterase